MLVVALVAGFITPAHCLSFITCNILKNFYVNLDCIYTKQPFCSSIMNIMKYSVRGRRNCPFQECDGNLFESCVSGNACSGGMFSAQWKLCGKEETCCSNPPDTCEEMRFPKYNGLAITHKLGFKVVCDSVSDGGGWTIIQRRFDGSQSFDQDWKAYEEGFGDINGEFWMGFDNITKLLQQGTHEIRFEIQLENGNRKFVQYNKFSLGSKEDKYKLGISRWNRDKQSTADGSSIEAHNGMAFTTKDMDNDKCRCLCASSGRGGWWYKRCLWSNLNGSWGNKFLSRGPLWISETGFMKPLLATRIKIRKRAN